MSDNTKSPRLFVEQALAKGQSLSLDGPAHHYLKNVLRVEPGEALRLFNGRDGEFLGRIESVDKKSILTSLQSQLRPQKNPARAVHLLFAPIKKERMDYLIEKAVELGVTDLHPVFTQNTDVRKINEERLEAQMIEAAEQCERLDVPTRHDAQDLFKVLAVWDKSIPLLAALERIDAQPLKTVNVSGDIAILIGPSGGFTGEEKEKIAARSFIRPVSLGENILRSETAAVAALAILNL